MAPLRLHELSSDEEFKPLVDVEHEAYSKPLNGVWEILKGSSRDEFCARQLSWHKSDPTSNWIYVTDEATGEVIGGTQWNIHKTNPFAVERTPLTAYWLPEGTMKQIGDQLMLAWESKRPTFASKPHLLIEFCFVHSAHRRQGAAKMMLEWGTKKADELGLEAIVESTESARPVYEKSGFYVIDDLYLDAQVENPSEEFQEARQQLGCPIHGFVMKRDPVSTK
ncbi:uncharacterized protein GGS22DRAFT_117296 [Annulohypoxylon maeteangense]|uniref:uncharacterized protein n=1 Tax=Annulohypoxylon maeteangense TaxID=1927788 RepID=UPI0020088436|nr:uncharacterized protein GGS22DRAFT_117296 [Annulohypoxylon maeteangense]KAI0886765.1 hypothetical protein GGS22DRAFT_117296 [Annulohypoxylon maeteangense]